MASRDREEIIRKLSYKYDLPVKVIDNIINYQFKYIADIMKKGNFDTIRLPYFGKFAVNKNRVKHINNLKHNKK
jgi:nucleoid DNA-binding protein